MFELRISASNTNFSGKTEVYDQSKTLSEFAWSLKDFPNNNETLFYENGKRDDYAFFSMKLYAIDTSGRIGVSINLESNTSTDDRKEEKNKVELEIIVEPAAIDNFQRELVHLAWQQVGIAILYGADNSLDTN